MTNAVDTVMAEETKAVADLEEAVATFSKTLEEINGRNLLPDGISPTRTALRAFIGAMGTQRNMFIDDARTKLGMEVKPRGSSI
jgi:hypothetical protein